MGKAGRMPSAGQPQAARQLRLTQSSLGQVIPLAYGEQRMAGNLLFAMYFTAIPHSGGPSGGKAGGRSVFVQYTYTVSGLFGLCEAPLLPDPDIPCTWGRLDISDPDPTLHAQIAAVGRATPGSQVLTISDKNGKKAKAQSVDGWSPALWALKKVRRIVNDQGKSPIPGDPDGELAPDGDDKDDRVGYRPVRYHNWDEAPDSNTPVTGTARFLTNPNVATGLPGDLIRGAWKNARSSNPDGPINHQRDAYVVLAGENYFGIVCAARQDIRCGSNASIPNHNWPGRILQQFRDIYGPLAGDVRDTDCDPACVLFDLLTNPKHGAGWDRPVFHAMLQGYPNPWGARLMASTTPELPADSWSAYCRATNTLISPYYTSQQAMADILSTLGELTNTAIVWSEGRLKMIPYGDQEITSAETGVTFTPSDDPDATTDGANIAIRYDLTPDDFLPGKNKDTVDVERRTLRPDVRGDYKSNGLFNHIRVECLDWANGYAQTVQEDDDSGSIQELRRISREPFQFHEITNPALAKAVATRLVKRFVVVRSVYRFTIGWQFVLLEPMDVVTLTDPDADLDHVPARITSITEDKDGNLEVEAEDYPRDVPGAGLPTTPENPTLVDDEIILFVGGYWVGVYELLPLTAHYADFDGQGYSEDWTENTPVQAYSVALGDMTIETITITMPSTESHTEDVHSPGTHVEGVTFFHPYYRVRVMVDDVSYPCIDGEMYFYTKTDFDVTRQGRFNVPVRAGQRYCLEIGVFYAPGAPWKSLDLEPGDNRDSNENYPNSATFNWTIVGRLEDEETD